MEFPDVESKLSIPNVFYDLIVFASSTVLFAAGLFFGLGQHHNQWYRSLGTANIILILAILLFLSYEYGRIAEAWSANLVQTPLQLIRDHTRFLKNKDFLAPLSNVESVLGINVSSKLRDGGKWAVYFYAMGVNPTVGSDLLKRYAWEKLSRNSALTFCLLTITSVTVAILNSFGVSSRVPGSWVFGSAEYTCISFVCAILTYGEYYRRNCWNNDLLERVVPVLAKLAELTQKSSTRE
jgi:hypothetical protein